MSLYGGVGHAPDYLAGRGFATIEIDTVIHSGNDLSSVLGAQAAEMLAEDCDVLGIEIDCSSWSLARRAPLTSSMPHRLRRKGKEIWGIAGLQGGDRRKVRAANRQLRSAIKIVKRAIRAGKVSGYLENPLSSLMRHVLKKAFY